MVKRQKWAVIGCGNVSGTYLYTLGRNPEVDVVAVVDPDTNKSTLAAKKYNIGTTYTDFHNVLREHNLDAVAICSPHFEHHDQAVYAAEKGIHVLCEKPLATNLADIEDMVRRCEGVNFGVMLQRRNYPNTLVSRAVVEAGLLGDIEEVSLDFSCHKTPEFYNTWRGQAISGGGTLLSQALHRVDQLVYVLGSPKAVEGITRRTRDYIEVEDYAEGDVYFNNGIKAHIVSNNSSGDPATVSKIRIQGTRGKIVMSDDKTPVWEVEDVEKPGEIDINDIPAEHRPPYYGPGHERVIDDFVSSISNNWRPRISGADSLDAMRLTFGFYESAKRDGKIIEL